MRAVKLYIKLGKRIVATIRQLGYPTKNSLKSWYREYVQCHDLPAGYVRSRPKYSPQQKRSAVEHYLNHDQCLAATVKALGFPSCETLAAWIRELYPDLRHVITRTNNSSPFRPDEKYQAVSDLCTRHGSAQEVAQKIGVSRPILYKWKNDLIGDEAYQAMRKRNVIHSNEEEGALLDKITQFEIQVHQLQLERDILTKVNELIKKDLGIKNLALTNREKTRIIDALRETYPLPVLLGVLKLARSCYFYHQSAMLLSDKYAEVRVTMADIFNDNYHCYGYRRIHSMLRQNNKVISEKVVRRLMAEEQLVVRLSRRRRYSSYCGEIDAAPENLLARDFSASSPDEKWLTDITEFQLPAGKVYLSPILDCFDGKVVSWSIGTRPDAQLVNTMLDEAINKLTGDDRPIIHSNKGGHYRWPGWLERIQAAGLVRSMSRKGCSSDNAACEGFFDQLKNEMYYVRDWSDITLEGFMQNVDTYIRWYNEHRIKMSLEGMSPVKYRQQLGIRI